MNVRYLLSGFFMLGFFICFEAANLTGFSWTRLRRLSDVELIESALRYAYPDIYSNLAEFKVDYGTFTPEVHYWKDLTGEAGNQLLNKLLGLKLFAVRLPEDAVIVASDGIARFSRRCGANWYCSPASAPDRPRLGIVGTVQGGPPSYDVARDFTVQLINGSEGSVFISGHCFAAFSHSSKPTLRVGGPNGAAITIGDQFGYRLIAVKEIARPYYSTIRISEQEFVRSQSCEEAVRAEWPNVGGGGWKR